MVVHNLHPADEHIQRGYVLKSLHEPIVANDAQHQIRDRVEQNTRDLAVLDPLEEQTQCDGVRDEGENEEDRKEVGEYRGHLSPQTERLHDSKDDGDEDEEEAEIDQQSGYFVVVEETCGDFQETSHSTLLLVDHRNQDSIDNIQATKYHQQTAKPHDIHVCGHSEFTARGEVLECDLKIKE